MKPRLFAAALALAASAQAELIEVDFGAGSRFEQTIEIAPKGFAEICGRLAKGSTVDWRFDAAAPLDFNVHYHVGKKVQTPVLRKGQARGEGRFAARSDQDYCWMWTNPGDRPVRLEVDLKR